MATVTLRETFHVAGALTNMTSVELSNEATTYGVKRNDTDAVVVADGTAYDHDGVGVYSYTFTAPALDLIFTAWVEWVYGGEAEWVQRIVPGPTSSDAGLVTLAELKTYLSIAVADWDDELTWAIKAAEDQADKYCKRTFLSTDYTEWIDGPGDGILYLPNRPLTAVSRISNGEIACMSVKCAASDATQATVSVSTTAVNLYIADGADAGTTELLFADYATMTLMAAQIAATAGTWTATVPTAYASFQTTILRPTGGQFCHDGTTDLHMPTGPETGYRVKWDEGSIVTRCDSYYEGEANIYVAYTAGYTNTTCPDALKQVIMEMAAAIFNEGQHDISLKSETLGDYSWTAADTTERFGARFGYKLGPFAEIGF